MNKRFKALLNILSGILIFSVIVPVLVSFILTLKPVQSIIKDKVTKEISKFIDSDVVIKEINIQGINNYQIEGLYVQDPVLKDTLVYIDKALIEIESFGFAKSAVVISNIYINNGSFVLNQYKDSTTNIKNIINKFKGDSKPKKGKDIIFKQIALTSMDFHYRKYKSIDVEHGIDFTDLSIENITGSISNFKVDELGIHMKVNSLQFSENENITMKNLSIDNLILSPEKMVYDGVSISIGNSLIEAKHIGLKYDNWDMSNFITNVPMEIDITKAEVDFLDVAQFTQKKRKWRSKINLSLTMKGTISDFYGDIRYIKTLGTHIENAKYEIKGIPDVKKMWFNMDIENIKVDPQNIYSIINDFSNKESLAFINSTKYNHSISANASFVGKISEFETKVKFHELKDNGGTGLVDIVFKKQNENLSFDGNLIVENLNIGNIISNPKIGSITSNIDLSGYVNSKGTSIEGSSNIKKISLLEHDINNIIIDGKFKNNIFTGNVNSKDTSLNFNLNGSINLTEKKPSYNAYIDINKINLKKFGIVDHDSISSIATNFMVNGSGVKFEDMTLNAKIDNLVLKNSKDTLKAMSSIDLSVHNISTLKNIEIRSQFIDITSRGVANIETIYEYFNASIATYLPIFQLDGDTVVVSDTTKLKYLNTLNINDNYIVNINLKKQSDIIKYFIPDLTISEGTRMTFRFNPYNKSYALNLNSQFLSYKNNMISNLAISGMNRGDSLNLYLSAKEIIYQNIYIPNLSLINNIYKDNLNISVGFNNKQNKSKLLLKIEGDFHRNATTNQIELKTILNPSYYRFEDRQWDILGGEINIYEEKIFIYDVNIISKEDLFKKDSTYNTGYEEFIANGILSKEKTDTLMLKLSNFNIKPISIFLENIGFELRGQTSGELQIVGALDKQNIEIIGELETSSFKVNKAQLEDSRIIATYDQTSKLNKFYLLDNNTHKKNIDAAISWIDKTYNLQFDFDQLNPIVISPFLKSFAKDVDGEIKATLNVSNSKDNPKAKLNGEIFVKDLSTTIDFTNVRYSASGYMNIVDNIFTMDSVKILDPENGIANMDIKMAIDTLTGFSYNIDIKPNSFLALNTSQRDNPVFYGKVYASGDVNIHNGEDGKVNFFADATTEKKSKFVLPLSHNSNISSADFIKFVTKNKSDKSESWLWNMYKNKNTANSSSGLNMRLDLNVTDNTEIEIVIDPISGSTINSRGNGEMVVNVDPSKNLFNIDGEYTISSGTYRFIMPNFNLVNKIFTIKEGGWIRFNGNPMNATLDIDAIYKVKASLAPLITTSEDTGQGLSKRIDVDCIMNIKDNLNKPNIVLDVDVPNTDPETSALVKSVLNSPEEISNQFIFLLLSNSFMAQESSAENNNMNVGLMSGIVTGIEFLTNRIRDIISTDKFDFSVNYMPRGGITSDEVSLGISTPLYQDKILLDVMGNFNFKNNSAAIASDNLKQLSGEVYLTWVLNDSGNLRFKGFTRTIDTFDENQGLQEAGVGVYYKEEFNSIKELKQKHKINATERKKRKAKREAARKIMNEEKQRQKAAKKAAKEQNNKI